MPKKGKRRECEKGPKGKEKIECERMDPRRMKK
jgi:hypothetical protein